MSPPENSVNNNYSNKGRAWEIRFTSIDSGKSPSQFAASPALRANLSKADAIDAPDLVCLSHLRWNFVFQRPQHLLTRCAQGRRVFFIEEPVFSPEPLARLEVTKHSSGVWVVVPHLQSGLSEEACTCAQRQLIDDLFAQHQIGK